jgi:hypothetical protein
VAGRNSSAPRQPFVSDRSEDRSIAQADDPSRSEPEVHQMRRHVLVSTLLAATAVLALAACASGPSGDSGLTSAVSEDEARQMIEAAMVDGYNAGDYAAYSANWSDAMKAGIDEAAFLGFHEQAMAQVGRFVAIDSLERRPGAESGSVRWVADLEFEKGAAAFAFAFRTDGELIEGVFVEEAA